MAFWTPLHAQIQQTLKSRQLLPSKSWVLIALSGGQDSLCLTKLLLDLQPKWGWNLAVAHCNHGWRSDSSANAQYVAELAKDWQLPFYLEEALEPPQTEAAARHWRYQRLLTICLEHQFQFVVTAHTATDRAETLLYNLIRGAGAEGLQALTWKRSLEHLESQIQLVRPLLEISRSQTAEFCQANHLQVWEDSTNQNIAYTRNRIRLELMPSLASFNPQVEKHLGQTAELLRADVEFLELQSNQLYDKLLEFHTEIIKDLNVVIRLNRTLLKTAHLSLQRRVLHRLLTDILPTAPNFEQVEKIITLVGSPNRSRTDTYPGNFYAEVAGDWIEIHHQAKI